MSIRYWFDGLPLNLNNPSAPTSGLQFWFNGLPLGQLFSASPTPDGTLRQSGVGMDIGLTNSCKIVVMD